MASSDRDTQKKGDKASGVFAKAVAFTGKTRTEKKKKVPERRFTESEVAGVLEILKGLQLPLPEKKEEFLAGAEGCILFINRYGTVVRIEKKVPETDINDSGWVLQPLARFESGSAVVEICPACAFESDKARYDELKKNLKQDGLKLWDSGLRQLGRIPFKTPENPDGVTVVIDRGAVRKLKEDIKPVKNALQDAFYGPLRRKAAEAYDGKAFDAAKVTEFWTLCEEFVRDGKLVAGWNNYQPLYDNKWEYKTPEGPKGLQAASKARAYEQRFNP